MDKFTAKAISIFMLVTILLLAAYIGKAQTPSQPKPSINQPTEQQKKALKEAADNAIRLQQQADIAKDKFTILLLNVWGELGLKPSETQLLWDQQGLPVFTKIDPQQAANANEKKKEDATKKTP